MNKEKEIYETDFWRVVLAEDQTYLGYCLIKLKRRECSDLADLTEEELLDFFNVVKKLEYALRNSFDATIFNWSCLMNNAYQNIPPTPHMHWHCRPRYNHPVLFAGLDFVDHLFGHHYEWPQVKRILNDNVRSMVIEEIRKFIID